MGSGPALGGKVLRIDPVSGAPPPDNPFAGSADPATRLVYTYGHRNVQGLAVQPGTGALYSAEHGPDVDDEVNLLRPGANYGWDPVGSGTYDESRPMTDTAIDGAVPAVWSSGSPTLATSGCAFLDGPAWGPHEGELAIAALKASALYLLRLPDGGGPASLTKAAVLDGDYGRLRTVEPGGDGVLYVTTSNGDDDKILRVTV
ncbi:PQQ-dependent sugar dehydrogenase [Cumulibacter manganitolerans]|uniref:PQQ-dependent sugar dehydrogenase n=1 Tax=Cumulibacter manganitolerans TaxID=1884992 RepID=UPI001E51C011|nr:PQQ-dependent sugar dehydrogenase [Cumulibacter manganitolerans]